MITKIMVKDAPNYLAHLQAILEFTAIVSRNGKLIGSEIKWVINRKFPS